MENNNELTKYYHQNECVDMICSAMLVDNGITSDNGDILLDNSNSVVSSITFYDALYYAVNLHCLMEQLREESTEEEMAFLEASAVTSIDIMVSMFNADGETLSRFVLELSKLSEEEKYRFWEKSNIEIIGIYIMNLEAKTNNTKSEQI